MLKHTKAGNANDCLQATQSSRRGPGTSEGPEKDADLGEGQGLVCWHQSMGADPLLVDLPLPLRHGSHQRPFGFVDVNAGSLG